MSEPTIVCVLGMHRSGTSLVMRMLNVLGLELGPEEHLMRPSDANPAGHWESRPIAEINEDILGRLGGSWAVPPALSPGWERSPELAEPRRQARALIEQDFSGSELWGFKDPRNSLTAPFWRRLLPPMRYVVCLRNPMDVAASLHAREAEPVPLKQGIGLWLTYVSAALANTAGHPRHFVFYEDLMADPDSVIRPLARFVRPRGDASEADLADAVSTALSEGLWHHRSAAANVVDAPDVGFHIKALYLALRLFVSGAEPVRDESLDLFARYAADAGRQLAELDGARQELDDFREQVQTLDRERVDLERRLSERGAEFELLAASHGEEQQLRKQLEDELETARVELDAERQAAAVGTGSATGEGPATEPDDADPVGDVRERVRELIPSGATVLVAAKGDESLLELNGTRGWHFPMAPDGRYAGYHPAGDTAAIAQLEALRARGADHLLLPATTLWWLDHYEGFRRHLDDRYVRLLEDEHCAIYGLRGEDRRQLQAGPIAALRRIVASLRIRTGSNPSVLDWTSGLGLADHFPHMVVFGPPHDGGTLPYLDGTVDIVVAPRDAASLAEARRVAASAVISVDPSSPERCELEWLPGFRDGWGEDVSVALIGGGEEPQGNATLSSLIETLDDGFAGDLSVVGTGEELEPAHDLSAAGVRPREVEVERGATLRRRAAAALEAAGGRVCVFVTAPAVPLPEWLPSMAALFTEDDAAGIVGPRILRADGTLEEAGGIVGTDGARQRRGEGDNDPDRPEYRFVRRVDFCSPPLLATRRELFERLDGFDDRRPTAVEAVIDFSLRAGESGAPVYYQPHARVVATIGGSR
jgi:hypothetical protein